ncbi:MAG TPA: hypothetical protein VK949_06525 [Methylotenera sp.]|nr:hypothetical protein [Methylotenera sp.]
MRKLSSCSFFLGLFFSSLAVGADFTGTWSIDLRSTQEKKNNAECGTASFALTQQADSTVVGVHQFSTVGCGRINEGSSIEGKAKGLVAILVITSGRNNAVVKGKATLKDGKLYWHVLKELSPGDPPNDGLILGDSVLEIEK